MSKRAPRLQFTDEELAAPEISKAAKKAVKRIEKLEQAEAKIPVKNGAERPRPASKLQHAVRDAPGKAVRSAAHREIQKSEDDNVGVESAHKLEETAEQTAPITPNAMSGFFAGSNTPNNAGSVIPTTAIKQDDIAVVFKRLFFVLNQTPRAAPPTAMLPYANNGKK